ncbi:hypothetical protein FIBSPDRAFT_959680 [Athelia psychrophila]|uniref:Uncharacterized protein n=1 Tax=Athelia psychrophila TaxID=1759441 RepID=A0A166D9Q7_9AGAM|nr:hypothetical protein FIBSPDRAFT_959680 [Fibularhizoctonia sp. CBS 109695]
MGTNSGSGARTGVAAPRTGYELNSPQYELNSPQYELNSPQYELNLPQYELKAQHRHLKVTQQQHPKAQVMEMVGLALLVVQVVGFVAVDLVKGQVQCVPNEDSMIY